MKGSFHKENNFKQLLNFFVLFCFLFWPGKHHDQKVITVIESPQKDHCFKCCTNVGHMLFSTKFYELYK